MVTLHYWARWPVHNASPMCFMMNYLAGSLNGGHSDNRFVFIKCVLGIRLAYSFRSLLEKDIRSLIMQKFCCVRTATLLCAIVLYDLSYRSYVSCVWVDDHV